MDDRLLALECELRRLRKIEQFATLAVCCIILLGLTPRSVPPARGRGAIAIRDARGRVRATSSINGLRVYDVAGRERSAAHASVAGVPYLGLYDDSRRLRERITLASIEMYGPGLRPRIGLHVTTVPSFVLASQNVQRVYVGLNPLQRPVVQFLDARNSLSAQLAEETGMSSGASGIGGRAQFGSQGALRADLGAASNYGRPDMFFYDAANHTVVALGASPNGTFLRMSDSSDVERLYLGSARNSSLTALELYTQNAAVQRMRTERRAFNLRKRCGVRAFGALRCVQAERLVARLAGRSRKER